MFLDKIYSSKSENIDSSGKSMVKAISWRILGTMDRILISWLLTGTLMLAQSIGSIEVFSKFFLY
jgi:hypothetical protein